jgi:hypothetical protein
LIKQSIWKVSRWWCKDTKSQGQNQVQAIRSHITLYSVRYTLPGIQASPAGRKCVIRLYVYAEIRSLLVPAGNDTSWGRMHRFAEKDVTGCLRYKCYLWTSSFCLTLVCLQLLQRCTSQVGGLIYQWYSLLF